MEHQRSSNLLSILRKTKHPTKIMFQSPPLNLSLFSFLIIFALFQSSFSLSTIPQNNESRIRGMFVFGSSVVDDGNNNFLPNASARADFCPYGVDFPLGPTGRFTNGENVADILRQELKIPNLIPPFNNPSTKGSKIVHGVNYGSGDSGILDATSAGRAISLNQQIRNFEKVTLPELELQLGKNSSEILSQFLFLVASAGNDYALNYFMGLAGRNVSLEAFTTSLITTLSGQLKKLYGLGARKFVLWAINPNGCSPRTTAMLPTREGCNKTVNRALNLFNANLKNLVHDIRPQLPGSNLVFVNAYNIILDIIRNPISKGFRDVRNACCEVLQTSEGGTGTFCKRGGSVCTSRSEYVFFDNLHTTEAVNIVVATKAFSSHLEAEVYPFNVKKLSEI